MWRRIRICVAVLIGILFVAIATGQALHAWRTSEGLAQQEGDSGCAEAAASSGTGCAVGDLSCQVQQQAERVSQLQALVAAVSKVANEALEKAEHAASAATKIAKATAQAHKERDAQASAAAAPLSGHGAAPLAAPPASKGDIAAMAKGN